MSSDEIVRVRLDKWLWAARFFKTRALAATAIETGKVEVNGERAKRAKQLQVGDQPRMPPSFTPRVKKGKRRGRRCIFRSRPRKQCRVMIEDGPRRKTDAI